MKKGLYFLMAAMFAATVCGCDDQPAPAMDSYLTAVSAAEDDDEGDDEEESKLKKSDPSELRFPAYTDGKNEFNHTLYEIEPFSVSLALPQGWEIRPLDAADEAASLLMTPVGFYRGEEQVGTIGYFTYEPVEEEVPADEYYKVVYPNLRLGSMTSWGDYEPVCGTSTGETALMTVSYHTAEDLAANPGALAAVPVTESPGIVSYDDSRHVYVALHLLPGHGLTQEEILQLAQSIEFCDSSQ